LDQNRLLKNILVAHQYFVGISITMLSMDQLCAVVLHQVTDTMYYGVAAVVSS